MTLKEGLSCSGVLFHGKKGKICEKVALKEGLSGSGVLFHGNMKGEIFEKAALKEGWSLVRGSFPWKHEGKDL